MTAIYPKNTVPLVRAISTGLVPGVDSYLGFGRSDTIAASTGPLDNPQDVWNGGGLYTGFPAGDAETLTVVSASLQDTLAGTGMRVIRLNGLLNGRAQTEDVEMDGTNPVETTKLWDRMPLAFGISGGSAQTNLGAITIAHSTTTANIFAVLPAGYGTTEIAAYTVPEFFEDGTVVRHGVIVKRGSSVENVDTGQDKDVEISWSGRVKGSSLWRNNLPVGITTGGDIGETHVTGIILEPGSDIVLRVIRSDSANLLTITGSFEVLLF